MNKFQKIELVLKNTCIDFVENDKKASEFVEECDSGVAALLGSEMFTKYLNEGASVMFDKIETYQVYRNKQKDAWNLVKQLRAE